MSQVRESTQHPTAYPLFGRLSHWRRRNQAIRELRRMARWRLSDLGISRDQIPAFVDSLLSQQVNPEDRAAPSEVQATRTGWMPGPWADGLAGS